MSSAVSGTPGIAWRALFVLVWLAVPAFGLDPRKPIAHYSQRVWHTADGLPQESVRAIAQTRDGYLWLGTQAGLARFDGEHFSVFDSSNSPLKHGHILSLCATRDGALWIGAGDSDGLYRWTHEGGLAVIWPGASIRALFEGRDGVLWAGTQERGLLRITRIASGGFRIQEDPAVRDTRAITQDAGGWLWIGTEGEGLLQYDGKVREVYGRNRNFPTRISALWRDAGGSLWVGTRDEGIFRLSGTSWQQFRTGDEHDGDDILALWGDRDGSLWIGTNGAGIRRYQGGRFTAYNTDSGLSGDIVRAIFEDREGSIWLGTAGAGLDRLKDDPFVTYGRQDGLSNGLICSMAEGQDGTVWIGTAEGWLNRYQNGRITRMRVMDPEVHGMVTPLIRDRGGNLWAGYSTGVVPRIRLVQGSGSAVEAPQEQRLPGAVRALAAAPDGSIWLGYDGGLVEFGNPRSRRVYTTADGLPSNRVRALAFDRQGRMCVATANGLAWKTGDDFQMLRTSTGPKDDSILALWADERDDLWLGSRTEGLYRFRQDRVAHYTRNDGLPDNQVFSILEDKNRNLWLTCRRGIYRISMEEIDRYDRGELHRLQPVIYETLDGLEGSEVNYDAKPPAMRTRDGRFWFATYGGVSVVDPAHLNPNRKAPPVYIERVVSNGTEFPAEHGLSLGPAYRNIEIHYTAVNFRAPERVKFRYRMDGFDRDWVEADTRRVAYYTNLPPGRYRFRVIACNSDGIWNTDGAGIEISFAAHFYETSWFWSGLVGCMSLAGYYAVRGRTRLFQARQAELARHVDERTQELQAEIQVRRKAEEAAAAASRIKGEFLANMSHEIRTPMNGIIGMAQLAFELSREPEQQEYLKVLQNSADSLLALLNDILDLSRIEAGKLNIELVPFDPHGMVGETVQLLQVSARAKGLSIDTEIASDVPPRVIADPLRLRQVLANLLGNAIKFTEKGRIDVSLGFGERAQTLRLAVRDTGIGIPRDKQEQVFEAFMQADGSITRRYGGTGLGLAITAKLVHLMGGTIRLESAQGQGSLFEVTVPYQTDSTRNLEAVAPAGSVPLWRPIRVLLAEDNPVNQKVASRLLERRGHSVVIVATGTEAVEAAARETFDLILMDVQMPVMDGLEAAAEIRAWEACNGSHVPIIAMTAHAMSGDRERCLQAGMDDYLAKPLRSEKLFRKIAEIQQRDAPDATPLV